MVKISGKPKFIINLKPLHCGLMYFVTGALFRFEQFAEM